MHQGRQTVVERTSRGRTLNFILLGPTHQNTSRDLGAICLLSPKHKYCVWNDILGVCSLESLLSLKTVTIGLNHEITAVWLMHRVYSGLCPGIRTMAQFYTTIIVSSN